MSLLNFLKKKTEDQLQAPPQPLPHRNDLCWCGSGTRYKECHELRDQETLKRIKGRQRAAQARQFN